MALRQPSLDPLEGWVPKEGSDWQSYECSLITPMFGGGVKAKVVDRDMPIRVSEIRGQLRFWWRLLERQSNPGLSTDELRRREFEIWGGMGDKPKASRVQLRVRECGKANFIKWNDRSLSRARYALFPADGTGNDRGSTAGATDLLDSGFSWKIEIRYIHNLKKDEPQSVENQIEASVTNALRWWAAFGGVGSRTRRGVGAVKVAGLNQLTIEDIEAQGLKVIVGRAGSDKPLEAWLNGVSKLREFRQGYGIGRNSGPGRSLWPEPDTVRDITKSSSRNHKPVHDAMGFFPRAAFGLPIIFKFLDERGGEPKQTELKPKVGGVVLERWASPIIIRPFFYKGSWVPSALVLPGARAVPDLELTSNSGNKSWSVNFFDKSVAKNIPPMASRGNHPLDAFLKFFTE